MGRRFGQHFLARKSILDGIAEAACGERARAVIEIGAGRGALTEPLLERSERVIAIEVDAVLVHYLRQKFHEDIEAGRLELVEGDVLKADFAAADERPVIVGNLPYYITAPILERVFNLQGAWERAVFLVQAEVAERIAAGPGTRNFGYLSVLVQTHACAEILFPVGREAFRPQPKVDSAVVRLTPRDAPAELGITDVTAFLKFAQHCFRHKRKTLRNNLGAEYGLKTIDALAEGRLRAEQVGLPELAALYRKLANA
ncbi:MAG: 16S rRNA (adenine(1518)-N(6)/adenine(1519)-N(6))-dimethyltransferase RsmA [Acidobacteriota bacterium]